MTSFQLHLDGAVKVATGLYRWDFGHNNQHRPASASVGPVSVTCPSNQRNVTLVSSTFERASKTHTQRGDLRQEVFYTVFPDEKYVLSASPAAGGGSGNSGTSVSDATIEAFGSDS